MQGGEGKERIMERCVNMEAQILAYGFANANVDPSLTFALKRTLIIVRARRCCIQVKTRVVRKTLNPVFDETFSFYDVDANQLTGISLHFVVLSFDRCMRPTN